MSTPTDAPAVADRLGHYYKIEEPYLVGREKVREYARAVQDHNVAHRDEEAAHALGYPGVVAPLTFTAIPAMGANRALFESVVVGYETYVQTEQVFEQHRPIVAGDELTTDVELSSIRRIAGRDLITVTNTFTDAAGEVVHTMHTTVVGVTSDDVDPGINDAVRSIMVHDVNVLSSDDSDAAYVKTVRPEGAQVISSAGAQRAPGSLDFDSLTVGDALPVRHARLSRGDLVNYAGVAGDPNPIHFSDELAKVIGLETVVAHGMQTMGLGASFITEFVGDPAAIYEYNVRFTSPVYVYPDTYANVDFTGKIKSLDPDTRRGVISIVAKQGDRKIFGRAQAHVQFN